MKQSGQWIHQRTLNFLIVTIILLVVAALVWTPTPAASQDAAAAITFYKDVLQVLQKNCQTCHRPGQIGPFSMLTFTWL